MTVGSYTVDWGDGDKEEYGPEYNGTFAHTYTEATHRRLHAVGDGRTPVGDYTAMRTAEIQPADPWLSLVYSGETEDGGPFYVGAYFGYDLPGHYTDQFPVEGHEVAYTVDWGDGTDDNGDPGHGPDINTYFSSPFTHGYGYHDPATFDNAYDFTVTATTDEYTATSSGEVGVLPAGSAELTPASDPGDVTEGQVATFNGASFTDSEQDDLSGYGATWTVWWGDTSSDTFDGTGSPAELRPPISTMSPALTWSRSPPNTTRTTTEQSSRTSV